MDIQAVQIESWGAAEWSATAAWVTALIAVMAATFALRQVIEARRLREAQAQPYVVAYMEPSPAEPQIVNVVVKNFGSTVARNVRLASDPPLTRSAPDGGSEEVWIFDELPILVPGQSWQTMWDFGPERAQVELPKRHTVKISARDYRGKRLPDEEFILDWSAYEGRQWVTEYGLHHAAKALRDMDRKMGKWQEGLRGGLAVFVRDGDRKDEIEKARRQDARERHAELRDRLIPSAEDEPPAAE